MSDTEVLNKTFHFILKRMVEKGPHRLPVSRLRRTDYHRNA